MFGFIEVMNIDFKFNIKIYKYIIWFLLLLCILILYLYNSIIFILNLGIFIVFL